MAWGFSVCQPCCGCCPGDFLLEWDVDLGQGLQNALCDTCTDFSGVVTFLPNSALNNFFCISRAPDLSADGINRFRGCLDPVEVFCNSLGANVGVISPCVPFANVDNACGFGIGIDNAASVVGILEVASSPIGLDFSNFIGGNPITCSNGVGFSFDNVAQVWSPTQSGCQIGLHLRVLQFAGLTPCFFFVSDFLFGAAGLSLTWPDALGIPITLDKIFSFQYGAWADVNCRPLASPGTILGSTGKPWCSGPTWPDSLTVIPYQYPAP